ncbi:MAG: alpha/beta hydrolase [Lachnospiraceae bacterium]|jgi:pimeloyl-ACP methyl ester carboxylesterase
MEPVLPTTCSEFSCVRDGMTIRGLVYRPEKLPAPGAKLPVAIFSHGFTGNYHDTMPYAETFAKMGFLSLCFDFNGGCLKGTSDQDTTKMSIYTEAADLKAVIRHARALDSADPDDITLMGFSQGSVVSAITASELQKEIRRLILFYPALCMPDDARKGSMQLARFDPQNIPETFYCGRMKLGAVYAQSIQRDDFRDYLKYQGPTLIVHGTADTIADVRYSIEAARIMKDARLFLVSGAGHNFRKKEEWQQASLGATVQFVTGYEEFTRVDVACREAVSRPDGALTRVSIPFGGTAEGAFTGTILPGASDEQTYQGERNLSMCADYTIQGKDSDGVSGTLHVINRGAAGNWHPTVTAEGGILSGFDLSDCHAVLDARPTGPMVHLYAKKRENAQGREIPH